MRVLNPRRINRAHYGPMTHVDTQALLAAVQFLTAQMEENLCGNDRPAAPEKLEKIARAISAYIKTLKEVDAYNLEATRQNDSAKYLSYEDYPPLRPEDRRALLEDITAALENIAPEPVAIQRVDSEPD